MHKSKMHKIIINLVKFVDWLVANRELILDKVDVLLLLQQGIPWDPCWDRT
jgi:hypothetical protein